MGDELLKIDDFKNKIEATTEFFKSLPDALHGEPVHRFAGGMYCRELTMPKDSMWISKVHKRQGFGIIIKGDVSVISEQGMVRYKAPCVVITEPGTQRALQIHEETTWLAITKMPEWMDEHTDLDIIEDYFACATLDDYDQFVLECGGVKCLIGQ